MSAAEADVATSPTSPTPANGTAESSDGVGPPNGYVPTPAEHDPTRHDEWSDPAGGDFAERLGTAILLLMGIVLFLVAIKSFFSGDPGLGGGLVAGAVITVTLATGVRRLELLKLDFLKFFRVLARFGDRYPPREPPHDED
jgi:hypothetical protein